MTEDERQAQVSSWEEWRRILYLERVAYLLWVGKFRREEAEAVAFERYRPGVAMPRQVAP
jgi:hypothetical protein